MLDYQEFLATYAPFAQLPSDERVTLLERCQIEVIAEGQILFDTDHRPKELLVIGRGGLELRLSNDTVLARLYPGDCVGQRSLLGTRYRPFSAIAIHETEVLKLHQDEFFRLRETYADFRDFFNGNTERTASHVEPLSTFDHDDETGMNRLSVPLRHLMSAEIVTAPPDTGVRECAATMATHGISSLLIVADDQLQGIVTDRDLRNRVLARGVSDSTPIREIMSPQPTRTDVSTYGFEAMLKMAKHRVHHLPVIDNDKVVGVVTSTDLLKRCATSAGHLVNAVYQAQSPQDLVEISRQIPAVLVSLVDVNASAHAIGHIISSLGSAINARLLQIAESMLGPPPVPYAWLSGGSLARKEQTALSDQDNFLVLSDQYDEREHGEYFAQLARRVCDWLNDCGYVYCPGEVMAITPQWRQPLATWKSYFDRWIDEPEPKALMLSCIFFDMRLLYGSEDLFRALQAHTLERSKSNRIYLAFMTANALNHQTPLGLLRNFVLIRSSEHRQTLDLKHNGVIPIVDLARIYSLATGLPTVNTQSRLAAAAAVQHSELSSSGAEDLRDALEFIDTVRLRHQAKRIKAGLGADNFVPPTEISHFERNHLKDAFALVRTMQSALAQRFQSGHI